MTFDEFLSRRSAELLRFAFVICGDRVAAESLVEQAALRVFADLGERDDPDAWAAAARVWTVRGFLSEGMVLGAPVASDVDTLIDAAHPAHGLVDNFARSSRLQRAVLVLHYREHFSEAEIANLVGSSEAGIVSYIGAILERLDVFAPGHPRGNSEQDLRRVLHVLGTDLAPADDLYTRISLALPQPVPTEAELAAAEVAAAEAAAAEAARAAELAEAEAALAAEVAAAEAAAAELAEAEAAAAAAAAAAELEALVTSIAAGTASEVATHVAADTAAGVAAEVAGATATEAATSLATTIAIDVARSTATDVATTVSTDVASRTAADVATGVATTTAGEVARLTAADVASSTAADVATGVAGKVARATATDVATTVSTTTANEVARATATDVASAVSTEVASSTATEVATGVATDVATTTAGEVARATATEVASSTATEVATGVATDVATTTAGEVARATATDVATDIATASAADVAAMTAVTATGVATEVATTTANDVAAGVARDVATSTADEIATRTASAVATDLATTTATDIATTTATDVALSIATSTASEVATAKATDVAASVSTDVASEVALTVATDAATRIATDVATHIAAAAVADAVAGAVADAVAHALVVAAPGAAPASEPTPESEPATDAIAEPLAVAEPRTITERVPVSEPPDGLEIAGSDLTPNEPDTAEPDQPAEITDDEPRDDDLPQEQLAEEAQDSPEESGAVELPAPDDPTVEVQVEQVQVEQVQARPTPSYLSAKLVRPLIVLAALLGVNYVVWRWTYSVNWTAWWISVPLVVAETYSLIGALLFGLTMWRLRKRAEPGPPPEGATVDVFIATYNEPIELVMKTAYAAQRINYPHTLWILDDGNRPELKELAEAEGIGVISRSSDWIDMPRHAKAGNLNSALMVTQGQFVVILDADQIPAPELLDHTLGYFSDKKMAFVQTPQCFSNVPQSDPLGSRTSLFFGPIQQGKDGWNSALFCGSNTVLRREALLQLGVRRYVLELELRIQDALDTTEKIIGNALAGLPSGQKKAGDALSAVLAAAQAVHDELDGGMSVADATARFQNVIKKLSRDVVGTDLAASQADLAELFDLLGDDYVESPATALNAEALERLARRDWSPLGAVETVRALLAAVDVDREDEAQPIMPMSTISVTEDLTTCMSIHGKGWKSAYHDEILAVGLAPEDLGTMLTQRLRRAQGTMQVMLRVNPLRQKGLSAAQRLMYLSTTWTYLSGFAAIVYVVAPAIFLLFGVLPVNSLNAQLFARLVPFFVLDQLLFLVVGRGRHTWRSRQFLFVLFPVWIKAVTSGVGNVVRRRSLSLAVTPKTRLKVDRLPWRLVPVQLLAVALLVVAAVVGIVRYSVGDAGHSGGLGTIVNIVWVVLDLALFSAIPRALYFKGFTPAPDESAAPAAPTLSPTVDRHETSITTSR